jgi:glycosyltransferase involved in cell wall biosynthesis
MTGRIEAITPDRTEFLVLSFEGPDRYSLAGGLGVRVSHLAQTLAEQGFRVHHIFVGDPRAEGEEARSRGKLTLHRWCQWISEYHPNGVYDGEYEKLNDFNRSVPPFVVERIVRQAAAEDRIVVVLGEEWHTAEAMCTISDLLAASGLRDRVVMFWNANNTFSFDRIDWPRLARCTTLTTVSRYMKQIMWGMGLNPLVIPNGIPRSLLEPVPEGLVARLRAKLHADLVLSKVARWDPDKRWNMAVEATAGLKERGYDVVLLARGGMEPHGMEVLHNAGSLGLNVRDVKTAGDGLEQCVEAATHRNDADIMNIRFHCSHEFLKVVYRASNAVLANSGHEPFGLVGLETMAVGGIAITGGTGEDYAVPFYNAIVLETSDAAEIEAYMRYLDAHPAEREKIRRAARQTAQLYLWENVTRNLIQKLEYQAATQGLLARERRIAVRTCRALRSRTLMPKPAPVCKTPVSTPALGVA